MKIKKQLTSDWQISTYVIDKIINKWDRDEAIMNLRDRIKQLELENGILKAESNIQEFNNINHQLEVITKNYNSLKNQMDSRNYKKFKKHKLDILQYLKRISL